MPIAIGDKVYDDELHYKMESIGIRPVQDEEPAPQPETRDRVMTPRQLEQNRAIIRDPNNIYDDQGNIVDYHMPSMPPIQPMQKEGDPLFTPISSSTMPLGSPTEPAGALKPSGGTNTPGNQYETSFIRPTPDYMNPPEGAPSVRPRTSQILKGFYETAKNALGLVQTPPWAMDPVTGEMHTSTQAIEKAADLAGLMVFGPAPVASKLADGTLGSFGGIMSKTKSSTALAKAQKMESDLASRDDIWHKTGWFRGADDRWRHEINDSQMKLKDAAFDKTIDGEIVTVSPKASGLPRLKDNATLMEISDFLSKARKGQITLEQAIDHPELFKAYPELRGVKILELPEDEVKMGTLGMMTGRGLFLAPNLHPDLARSVIMHEVQHEIQHIEGFTSGGSASMFRPKGLDEVEEFFKTVRTNAEKEIVESGYKPEEIANLKAYIKDDLIGNQVHPEVKKLMDKAKESPTFQKLKNIVQSEMLLAKAAKEHKEMYKRLRGEVEARNVQARLDYEQRTRDLIPPFRMEDRPRMMQNEPPHPWGEGPMKSEGDVIPFRRGANDNTAGLYNPREPNMIGSKELDDAIDESWRNMQKKNPEREERWKEKWKILDAIAEDIQKVMDKGGLSEFEKARLQKLETKWHRIFEGK